MVNIIYHLTDTETDMQTNIIDNYRDLPVGKYIDILKTDKRTDLEEIDKHVKILSILSDLSEDDILNLSIVDFQNLAIKTRFLTEPCDAVSNVVAKEYKIGGLVLCPVTEYRKITTAQYIDILEYSKNGDDNLVEILSCILIPKDKSYNKDYDIIEVQNMIRTNMSVTDVLSITGFFFESWKQSTRRFLTYLKAEAATIPEQKRKAATLEQIKQMEDSVRVGVGLQTLTP